MTPDDLEAMRADHESVFGDAACPTWVKESLVRYLEHGIPTGDFLRAVLTNDLQGAFARADVNSARSMAAIVGFIYRYMPHGTYGSSELVDTYLVAKRAERAGES